MCTGCKDENLTLKKQKISQTPINKGDLRDFFMKNSPQKTDWQMFRQLKPDFPENFTKSYDSLLLSPFYSGYNRFSFTIIICRTELYCPHVIAEYIFNLHIHSSTNNNRLNLFFSIRTTCRHFI